jgi:hypothetical protein
MYYEESYNISNLYDVIKQLNAIKLDNYLSIFHQDDYLKEYIKYIVDICSNIELDKLNKQKEYLLLRTIMFYLERLTTRLPARAEEGFIYYLFHRNAKGTLNNHVCRLYNKIFKSHYFRIATDINIILAEANESESLDLSYISMRNIDLNKILLFKGIKHLSIVELIIDGKSLTDHIKYGNFELFDKFVFYISQLSNLESIKLSGFYLCNKSLLKKRQLILIDDLSKLPKLSYLDLSNNCIDDDTLNDMFKIEDTDPFFSNKHKFINLKELNLSYNFLKFEKYHEYESEDLKTFFYNLLDRQITLDLTCNCIHYFDTKKLAHVTSNIFVEYKNIVFNNKIKCESVLNPHYLLDKDQCILAIANDLRIEHAQIMANFIDDNSQQCFMRYHLIEDLNKPGYTKIIMEQYDANHPLIDYVEKKSKSLVFGSFYLRNKTTLKEMENRIAEKIKATGPKEYLYRLHFIWSQDSLNCYRFCLKIFSQCIDNNISKPFVAIARSDLTNKIPQQNGIFCFYMLDKIISTNTNKVDERLIYKRLNV